MPETEYPKTRIPLLILSDSISCHSGLARIARDLALRLHKHCSDVFEVATVGYGGPGSCKWGFPEYHLHRIDNWLCPDLPAVWNDFAGEREGILFSVWDATRLSWLANPALCPIPGLRQWVGNAKMKKWLYHAIDAEGPNGKLSYTVANTLRGFDRVLDYSEFSCRITGNTAHLPHGIDTSVFYPRDRDKARQLFQDGGFIGLDRNSFLVGIVATNQARKNWQLGMETCKLLLDRGYDVRLWAHTNVIEQHWNIQSLIVDYGLVGRAAVTTSRFSDEQLAWMYSACRVTLGIGPEGFGFPLAESLACGTPVVTGSYGGQAEFVPPMMQIDPQAYYHENPFCSKRPIYDPLEWADKAESVSDINARLDECVNWNGATLWPAWQSWFMEGL